MNALILTLALCQLDAGVDGGTDTPMVVMDVVRGSLLVRPEGGGVLERVMVEEGCYMPTDSCIRAGKQVARKTAQLEEANKVGMQWLGAAFGAGALTGLAIGIAVGITQTGRKP